MNTFINQYSVYPLITRKIGFEFTGVVSVFYQHFTVFQGRIQYEVVGIYPAPSFFDVDKDSGVIRIIRDLKEDKSATGTYVVKKKFLTTIHQRHFCIKKI